MSKTLDAKEALKKFKSLKTPIIIKKDNFYVLAVEFKKLFGKDSAMDLLTGSLEGEETLDDQDFSAMSSAIKKGYKTLKLDSIYKQLGEDDKFQGIKYFVEMSDNLKRLGQPDDELNQINNNVSEWRKKGGIVRVDQLVDWFMYMSVYLDNQIKRCNSLQKRIKVIKKELAVKADGRTSFDGRRVDQFTDLCRIKSEEYLKSRSKTKKMKRSLKQQSIYNTRQKFAEKIKNLITIDKALRKEIDG